MTEQTTYEESGELDNFNRAAAREMRRRLEDGARKFGALSWRREVYTDADNVARLRRAVDHLVGVLVRWRNPETATVADARELWKRAADVSNQAFMLADQLRHDGNEPMPFDLTDSYNVGFREGVAHAARERPSALDVERLVDAIEPVLAEKLGDLEGVGPFTRDSVAEAIAIRILARLTEPDAGEGTANTRATGTENLGGGDPGLGATSSNAATAPLPVAHSDDYQRGYTDGFRQLFEDMTAARLSARLLDAALQPPAVEGGPE